MAAKKTETIEASLGALVKADHVIRPDGTESDIEGGIYVLDRVGKFTIGNTIYEVK